MKLRLLPAYAVAALALCALPACDGTGPNPVVSVLVAPATVGLSPGGTQQLTATLNGGGSSVLTGRPVTWSTSNSDIATVDGNGLVTAVAVGTATITAASEGKAGTSTVTVTNPVASVSIAPTGAALAVGATFTFTATLRDGAGHVLVGRTAIWTSSNPAAATVDSLTGTVTGVAPGAATITASSEGKSASVPVTVAVLANLFINPPTASVAFGSTQQFTLSGTDAANVPLVLPGATWASADTSIATVNAGGLATPTHREGTVNITATVGSKVATASLRVFSNLGPVSLEVSPDIQTIAVGADGQITATLFDAQGHQLLPRNGLFTSLNTAIATVDSVGRVHMVSAGTVQIRAAINFITRIVTVTSGPIDAMLLDTVSAGPTGSCGVTPAGDGFCWGQNSQGRIGDSSAGNVRYVPAPVVGGLSWEFIDSGHTSCGITTSGSLYCWGSGTTYTPAAFLSGQSFVALGRQLALQASGVAYAWGSDTGDGTVGSVTPVAVFGVPGDPYRAIALPGRCAITLSNAGYCWGNNSFGQVGDGTTTYRHAPVAVSGGLSLRSISSSTLANAASGFDGTLYHTCAVTTAGAGYCWGNGVRGQLGDGTSLNRLTPVAVPGGLTFRAISAGNAHTCGITTAGAAYCWGANDRGQLGRPGAEASIPAAVAGGRSYVAISAGSEHTCAVATTGVAYCWGANDSGQLGDGTNRDRTTPVVVVKVLRPL